MANKLSQAIDVLFGKAIAIPAPNRTIPGVATIPNTFNQANITTVNGVITWIQDNLESYIVNAYSANDIVYSIAQLVAEKVAVAPWGLYKVVDESALKRMNGFIEAKQFDKAKRMHSKALQPVDKFGLKEGRLNELLKWANDNTTFNELCRNGVIYKMITGNDYVYGDLLTMGANAGLPAELHNLPAQYMGIRGTMDFPQRVTGYQLNRGILRQFGVSEILHEKMFNPAYGANGEGLYGMSPIKAALRTTTRSNAASEAGAMQLQNGGSPGVLSVDDAEISSEDKMAQAAAIEKTWRNKYTGAGNFGKVAFSGANMKYTPVGLSIKDMGISELELIDLRKLCNVWGVPSYLLNDPQNKTYNNAQEAEKALTSRCALPHLVSRRNSLNRKLQKDWGMKGTAIYIDFDLSVYPELQDDKKEQVEWMTKIPMSPRYMYDMLSLDVPDDAGPEWDIVILPNNMGALLDMTGTPEEEIDRVSAELDKAGLTDYLRIAK